MHHLFSLSDGLCWGSEAVLLFTPLAVHFPLLSFSRFGVCLPPPVSSTILFYFQLIPFSRPAGELLFLRCHLMWFITNRCTFFTKAHQNNTHRFNIYICTSLRWSVAFAFLGVYLSSLSFDQLSYAIQPKKNHLPAFHQCAALGCILLTR